MISTLCSSDAVSYTHLTDAVKIALTGTPLLKEERASCKVFCNYLHTYYYDKSIADGYTLKIIREDIETSYKERLSDVYDKLETLVQKKDIRTSEIIEHPSYVNELARYIMTDVKEFRKIQDVYKRQVFLTAPSEGNESFDLVYFLIFPLRFLMRFVV